MMNSWDFTLVIVVSTQALLSSYLFHPKWKALMLSLPFPFTFASLSVGVQINAVHNLAMIFMFLFMQAVRVLYLRWNMPIIASIVLSAVGYCLMGWILASTVPISEKLFWISSVLVFLFALILLRMMPPREEPGHRSQMPILLKLPMVMLLILALVWLKGEMKGATAFFPMVGVFVAYEARKSLWTMGRQNAIVILAMLPMTVTSHLLFKPLGIGLSLVAGWGAFLLAAALLKRSRSSDHNTTGYVSRG
ncbi:hypothetical protein [Paenibacillus cymbidii]|uniref:hypothetical protein n=1 Tax=Paenibacillus cymbidii TaxID=1639034 RepID=UPI00108135A8|nr:hypothetical protein [Paenibacillus cymbidii]